MTAAYIVLLILLSWTWFRYRRARNNAEVCKLVSRDKLIVGDGYMRIHKPSNWFDRYVFGMRLEHLDPMDVTFDLDAEGKVIRGRYNGEIFPAEETLKT